MKVAVIGAGISGIMMGCRLLHSGIDDFVILEKAARPGGTWRDNTYPGVGCDIPSHLYCWSAKLKPDWGYRYATGAEILHYIEQIIEEHGLASRICYRHEASGARWDGRRWQLSTRDGRTIEADVVVSATGVLHHPAYPPIEGLDDFAGPVLHTARWRDDIELGKRRVGVIGTGTTATQLVAAIAPRVGALAIFQRTPSWILDVPNQRSPQWQERLLRWMPWLHRRANRFGTSISAITYGESFLGRSPLTRLYIERRCRRALRQVRDPALRRKLTPDYAPGCKRLVFSGGYYEAIQRSNVKLVTESIARIEPDGLLTADGEFHRLEALILATGFKADAFMRPMAITGADGISIEQVWAGKPIAYQSVAIPHLPNFFMVVGPYSPIANVSTIEVAEWQIGYILRCIDIVRRQNVSLAPTEAATAGYVNALDRASRRTVWASGCDSWYLGPDRLPSLYTRPPLRHRAELARAPDLRDFDVRPLR